MKLLGIIGGMSWTSTAEYYRLLNQEVARQRGGLNSARLLIHSLDFAEVVALQKAGQWDKAGELLSEVACGLERAGAEGILLATNTMHKVAPQIEAATSLPFFHIADATGGRIQAAGLSKVGLLATAFTMEQDFYIERLANKFGLEVLVPETEGRADIHRIIFDELCQNVITEESRQIYGAQMAELVARGAQAIILGCTEISLLVGAEHTSVPVFDTTAIHAEVATEFMLS